MIGFTRRTCPISIFQLNIGVFTADVAAHGSWFKPANLPDVFTTLVRHVLGFRQKGTECDVVDFTAPHAHHALEVQILKEAPIVLSDDEACQFPMMFFSMSGNFAVHTGKFQLLAFSVTGTSRTGDSITRLTIEIWTL